MTDFDVMKIAGLAHLSLDPAESEKLGSQVASILEYVDKLREVDASGVEPTAHVTGVSNVLRDDAVRDCPRDVRDALLEAAPAREGDYLKVKAVFK